MNRARICLIALLFSFLSSTVYANELVAFIGTYKEVKELPFSPKESENCNCIIMDMRYVAKYKIEALLHGSHIGNEIEFLVFDHYGFPAFAKQKSSLIYLMKNGDEYTHLKYEWDSVTPVLEGGFASCENTDFNDSEEELELKNYTYSPPIEVDLRHATKYQIEQYENDPLYQFDGSVAKCVKGISAEDIFKARLPEILEDLEYIKQNSK